jgi:diguanylate cyclase (GGDEF)-like protein
MAYKDQLTGIANRAAFEEKVDTYVKEHRDIVLFMFDINGLKYTNDTYGHTEGDFLIKNVAAVIEAVFASCGTVYRIGGDELVALVEQQPQFDAEAAVRKVNAELEGLRKTVFSDKPYHASVSTGFSTVPKVDAEKMKDALIFADRMMYAEKKANGKQRG